MSDFTPESGVPWTLNHGFSIGAEIEFIQTDVAEWLTDIPFSITALQIFGGSLNYNTHGKNGPSVALFRFAILGDPAGGDAGAGPGSVLLVNTPLYVFHGENALYQIAPFCVQLDQRRLPAPPDGSAYKFKMHVVAAGSVWPAHVEIALAGMWR